MREREKLGKPTCKFEDNMKMHLQQGGMGKAWTGLIWFRIGKSGRLL
jgi:hypothetical protein